MKIYIAAQMLWSRSLALTNILVESSSSKLVSLMAWESPSTFMAGAKTC
jgi:hypothetical protein